MYFIFHPANTANKFIYCPPNFADVVIGAFYFSYCLSLAICFRKQVLFQDRNTKKKKLHIYCINRVYLYIWLILKYLVIYFLCRYSLNITNMYGKCFSFKLSVVIPGEGTPSMLGDMDVPPFWPSFLTFWGLNSIFWGYFFSSTNTKTIFWGIKTTNSYRIRSFRPQISFFPRSFWVQVSAASGTPPSVFGPSTPPGGDHGMCCSSDWGHSIDIGTVNLWYQLLKDLLGKHCILVCCQAFSWCIAWWVPWIWKSQLLS